MLKFYFKQKDIGLRPLLVKVFKFTSAPSCAIRQHPAPRHGEKICHTISMNTVTLVSPSPWDACDAKPYFNGGFCIGWN